MNGGEAVVASLTKAGITTAIGIVGSSIIEVFDLLPKAGIRYVGVRHEQVAGHMADVYARITGTPLACIVQNGAGVTNVVTGVATAFRARSPMVVLSGCPTSSQLTKDTYQEIDHVGIMRPITKWSHSVNRADRIPEAIQRAVREAMTPPCGPTFVDIPRDYLYELFTGDILEVNQFKAVARTAPTANEIETAATMLRGAHHPVILAGGGIVWSDASNDVVALSERLNAPICTIYGHNDAVPNDATWFAGPLGRGGSKAAMRVFSEADVVLAIGTRMEPFTFIPYYGDAYFPKDARFIQIDNDARRIGQNVPVELGIAADAAETARALLLRLPPASNSKFTLSHLQSLVGDWRREIAENARWSETPLSMEAAYAALAEVMPGDAIRTLDIGSSPSFAYSMFTYTKPRTLIPPLGLGGVGFALPAALGARLAAPEATVVALLGDGAFSMGFEALFTAYEESLPFVGIVFDNGAWGAEKANQLHFYDKNYVGTNLRSPDIVKLSQTMGGFSVTANTAAEIKDAFRQAQREESFSII
ncbi:MAG: thiamine pyrophosphate-binding protein, partial [Vulcanimicrobiaceae bacterium]